MRMLHTADWHVGRTIRGRSRTEEHEAVLAEIVNVAAEEKVDLILVAGDLFDSSAPGPDAEKLVFGTLLELAALAEVAIVAGNHDHPSRLEALSPLFDKVRVHTGCKVCRAHEGGLRTVPLRNGERIRLILLPFLSHRIAISAGDLMETSGTKQVQDYQTWCRKIVGMLCEGLDARLPNILVGHFAVLGGTLGGGERQAHTVEEYYVPADIFPASLNYVALGHLHGPQKIAGKCPIWYSGSPLQLDFGEGDKRCEVLLVETAAGKPAEVECRTLSAGRKLRTLKGTLDELAPLAGDVGTDFLRLQLTQAPYAGIADHARELFPNAVHVELLNQDRPERRADPVQEGATPEELFRLYLKEKNVDDERLMVAFRNLWEEANATDLA